MVWRTDCSRSFFLQIGTIGMGLRWSILSLWFPVFLPFLLFCWSMPSLEPKGWVGWSGPWSGCNLPSQWCWTWVMVSTLPLHHPYYSLTSFVFVSSVHIHLCCHSLSQLCLTWCHEWYCPAPCANYACHQSCFGYIHVFNICQNAWTCMVCVLLPFSSHLHWD